MEKFERECISVLEYLFKEDLSLWLSQTNTGDGLNRFDLICKISSKNDFWLWLYNNFNSKYVVFEFKNYKDEIKQIQIHTTEKYLFSKAMRNVAFIISSNGSSENARKACEGILRENGKLIILLDLQDINRMIEAKYQGNSPVDILAEKLDNFLISIGR